MVIYYRLGILAIHFISLSCHAQTYLVFGGSRGWIGQKLVTIINERGDTAVCATARLEDRAALIDEIKLVDPDYIINAAGIIGKPNVNWCEDHQQETIRGNVLGLLNLVDVAYLYNIPVANVATGCIYCYDDQHPMWSGIGFTEEDAPNFSGSFYSRTKIIAEQLITIYPNVLNLRLRLPIATDLSPNGFIGKIIQYKKLVNIPNSMGILEDLLPLIPVMLERNLRGNYNFVNPGTMSHNQVIELYKQYINPNHNYENFSVEEQNELLKVPRSHCHLDVTKLLQAFPDIPNINESMPRLFERLQQKMAS